MEMEWTRSRTSYSAGGGARGKMDGRRGAYSAEGESKTVPGDEGGRREAGGGRRVTPSGWPAPGYGRRRKMPILPQDGVGVGTAYSLRGEQRPRG